MWTRRIDLNIVEPMANGFRFSEGLKLFQNRIRCIPEAAEGLKTTAQERLETESSPLVRGEIAEYLGAVGGVDAATTRDPGGFVRSLTSRLGEPVVRGAVERRVGQLGRLARRAEVREQLVERDRHEHRHPDEQHRPAERQVRHDQRDQADRFGVDVIDMPRWVRGDRPQLARVGQPDQARRRRAEERAREADEAPEAPPTAVIGTPVCVARTCSFCATTAS